MIVYTVISVKAADFDMLTSGGRITQTVRYELTYREMDQINNIYVFCCSQATWKGYVCQ